MLTLLERAERAPHLLLQHVDVAFSGMGSSLHVAVFQVGVKVAVYASHSLNHSMYAASMQLLRMGCAVQLPAATYVAVEHKIYENKWGFTSKIQVQYLCSRQVRNTGQTPSRLRFKTGRTVSNTDNSVFVGTVGNSKSRTTMKF